MSAYYLPRRPEDGARPPMSVLLRYDGDSSFGWWIAGAFAAVLGPLIGGLVGLGDWNADHTHRVTPWDPLGLLIGVSIAGAYLATLAVLTFIVAPRRGAITCRYGAGSKWVEPFLEKWRKVDVELRRELRPLYLAYVRQFEAWLATPNDTNAEARLESAMKQRIAALTELLEEQKLTKAARIEAGLDDLDDDVDDARLYAQVMREVRERG